MLTNTARAWMPVVADSQSSGTLLCILSLPTVPKKPE